MAIRKRLLENRLQLCLIVLTVLLTAARILLNEKGRTNPDSIRFMRTANVFPVIDNTVTPLGYPLSLKFFTLFGFDEFWASKIVGLLAYLFMVWFAWQKKFYLKEIILTGGLFSFLSIFSYTMSETLILPFVLVFFYVARQIIIGELRGGRAVLLLGLSLVILYNIRYPALFIIGAVFLFGLMKIRTPFGKLFLAASFLGFAFVALYKVFFIDYFDEKYVQTFLEIGLHPTSKLLTELWQGLATTFNPFIHIADPRGGFVNFGIYGLGLATMGLMVCLFIKLRLSASEFFLVFAGCAGIACSFFIQYFYSVNPIDYRLLAPFSLSIWLVFFRKLYRIFGPLTYGITFLSLMTGFAFTWLSRGNYLENRRQILKFLEEEQLQNVPVKFFLESEEELDKYQIAELISTVNPRVYITFKPEDTLQKNTVTQHRVLQKIKIDTNPYQ